MKRLVLLGGGHAHVEVLRSLALLPAPRWQVTLVTPYPRLTYSGMVPGHFAGHYALDECTIDLRALCERAGAKLTLTTVSLVSPDANEVICADATVLSYDVLSVNVGSAPNPGGASGVERHAALMRPLENAVHAFDDVLARAAAGRVASVSVVGGGAAAIELALAMSHRFGREGFEAPPHVRVLTDAAVLAPNLPDGARRRLRARLRERGIGAHTDSAVVQVGPGFIRLKSGLEFATEAVFWATGGAAPAWPRQSGLATDPQGYLLANERLQSASHPNVFGAGDCINQLGRSLPKAGVFAVRAGPVLAHNLAAALEGRPLVEHVPKARYLALISTGERHAVGTWGPLAWSGAWVWRWKDRIDRRFIARYRDLPPPGLEASPSVSRAPARS
jgi:pyridine nucleotide-disulfide oxidoreductase family protein